MSQRREFWRNENKPQRLRHASYKRLALGLKLKDAASGEPRGDLLDKIGAEIVSYIRSLTDPAQPCENGPRLKDPHGDIPRRTVERQEHQPSEQAAPDLASSALPATPPSAIDDMIAAMASGQCTAQQLTCLRDAANQALAEQQEKVGLDEVARTIDDATDQTCTPQQRGALMELLGTSCTLSLDRLDSLISTLSGLRLTKFETKEKLLTRIKYLPDRKSVV